jgi:hypothetical protein
MFNLSFPFSQTMTDQGRGRLFIRACLVKGQLAAVVRLLRADSVILNVSHLCQTVKSVK